MAYFIRFNREPTKFNVNDKLVLSVLISFASLLHLMYTWKWKDTMAVLSWDASLFCWAVIHRGVRDFGENLNEKRHLFFCNDREDTGGLSSDLSAFRCVWVWCKTSEEGKGADHLVIHIIPCCWGTRASCVAVCECLCACMHVICSYEVS